MILSYKQQFFTLFIILSYFQVCAQFGSIDSTFDPMISANNAVRDIAVQNDGKIVICGQFTSYDSMSRNYLARIHTDGTLDTTFDIGVGADVFVFSVLAQPNNKLLIGGFFSFFNGVSKNGIARLNTDGTIDTSFLMGSGLGIGGNVLDMVLQNDGKVIVVGNFHGYNGYPLEHIARLNTNGTLDTTFNYGNAGINNTIRSVDIRNGKIVIGGDFDQYNGTIRSNIALLNMDGTLDNSFYAGTGIPAGLSNLNHESVIQSDGKVITAGQFNSWDNSPASNILRFNTDGSRDVTFAISTNDDIRKIVFQSDEKMLLVGDFTTCNGVSRNRICRLNPDGSLDASFDPANGANSFITACTIQDDGKILIGGDFTLYDSVVRNHIARLLNCTTQNMTNLQAICIGEIYHINGNSYATTGTYYDTLTAVNGCDSIVETILTVDSLPDVRVNVNGNEIIAPIGGGTYQWVTCPDYTNIPSASTNYNYIATVNGDYAVIVSNNNCVDTSNCVTISSVGFQEYTDHTNLSIYPNPSNGNFILSFNNDKDQIATISILNSVGQSIYEYRKPLNSRMDHIPIELDQPMGIYFVKINFGDQLYVKRIAIE